MSFMPRVWKVSTPMLDQVHDCFAYPLMKAMMLPGGVIPSQKVLLGFSFVLHGHLGFPCIYEDTTSSLSCAALFMYCVDQ